MVIFFLMIRLPPRYTRTDTLFPYTTLFRSAVVQLCALSRRPSRTPDSFFPEQRPWRGPSERMNLSRTLSTSVIALALSVPLVLMARSGDGLPATSRVDQATTSKLVYGLLSDSRYAYRPRPLAGTLSADIFERYLDSLDGSKMFFIAPDIARFAQFQDHMGGAIKAGALASAFALFTLFLQTVAQTADYARRLLQQHISALS